MGRPLDALTLGHTLLRSARDSAVNCGSTNKAAINQVAATLVSRSVGNIKAKEAQTDGTELPKARKVDRQVRADVVEIVTMGDTSPI
jgi:hypothetical protein